MNFAQMNTDCAATNGGAADNAAGSAAGSAAGATLYTNTNNNDIVNGSLYNSSSRGNADATSLMPPISSGAGNSFANNSSSNVNRQPNSSGYNGHIFNGSSSTASAAVHNNNVLPDVVGNNNNGTAVHHLPGSIAPATPTTGGDLPASNTNTAAPPNGGAFSNSLGTASTAMLNQGFSGSATANGMPTGNAANAPLVGTTALHELQAPPTLPHHLMSAGNAPDRTTEDHPIANAAAVMCDDEIKAQAIATNECREFLLQSVVGSLQWQLFEAQAALPTSRPQHEIEGGRLLTAYIDPAVNLEIKELRSRVQDEETKVKKLKDELQAHNFSADSLMGRRLINKCRTLQAENQDLGRLLTENQLQPLQLQVVAFQKQLDFYKQQMQMMQELNSDLDEENERLTQQLLAVSSNKASGSQMAVQSSSGRGGGAGVDSDLQPRTD